MVAKAKKLLLSLSILVLFALYSVRAHQHTAPPAPTAYAQIAATSPAVAAYTEPTISLTPTQAGLAALTTRPVQPTTTVRTVSDLPDPTVTAPAAAAVLPTATAATGAYRDGTYTGSIADANWGNVEVQAVITKGRISQVTFLEYPNHRNRSQMINEQAMPQLIQEAITAQQANVDIVTGATDTSEAFIESLTGALHQASA